MDSGRFVKSNDTAILEHALSEVSEGETISYDDLSKTIGRDVRKHSSGCLRSARRILERDGVHFDCVAGTGLKRLAPGECVLKARSQVHRARRAAKRGRGTIETIDWNRLTTEEKNSATAVAAQSGAIELLGATKAERRLTTTAAQTTEAISIGKTLALFTDS